MGEAFDALQETDPRRYKRYVEDYEYDILNTCRRLVSEADRLASINKKRIVEGSLTRKKRQMGMVPMNSEQLAERRCVEIKKEMSEKLELVGRLGEEGRMNESKAVAGEIDSLKNELSYINQRATLSNPGQQSNVATLETEDDTFQEDVCAVCGLLIDWRSAYEVANRKRGIPHPHESGTLHRGYTKVREKLDELEANTPEEATVMAASVPWLVVLGQLGQILGPREEMVTLPNEKKSGKLNPR